MSQPLKGWEPLPYINRDLIVSTKKINSPKFVIFGRILVDSNVFSLKDESIFNVSGL
jgi:hypothetical protein